MEPTGCMICFVLSSTSKYEFLYTQSVFIDFNEPRALVHRYIIVVCGCCKL